MTPGRPVTHVDIFERLQSKAGEERWQQPDAARDVDMIIRPLEHLHIL